MIIGIRLISKEVKLNPDTFNPEAVVTIGIPVPLEDYGYPNSEYGPVNPNFAKDFGEEILSLITNKTTNTTENQTIWMPLLAYRFKVRVENDPTHSITKQVMNCTIDYVNSLISLTIRQPLIDDDVHSIIKTMCNRPNQNIYVEHIGSNAAKTVEFTNIFHNCKAVEHQLILDYAGNDAAVHNLVLKFGSHVGTK